MAQPTSYSMSRGGQQTSFLSFDDAPNSPHQGQTSDGFADQHYHSMSSAQALSSSSGAAGVYHYDQAGSPDSESRAPFPSRSSPSKVSRLIRSRPGSSKDLAAAAFADATDGSNRSESLHSSPPRPSTKPPPSRGSRLGALLGRTLAGNDSGHTRNTSSSTNQTEPSSSSNDSGFFGRRHRSKPTAVQKDFDEASDAKPATSSSGSYRLTNTQSDAARSASAMGMLDLKLDPSGLEGDRSEGDPRKGANRATRPSSQYNLFDSLTGSSARNSMIGSTASSAAPSQSRGGRLGRLAYKKEDSIAFIAQSRNASQQMAAGARHDDLDDAANDASRPAVYPASTGLGIENDGQALGMDSRPDGSSSAQRYASGYSNGSDHNGAHVGLASSYHTQSVTSSSNTSRAPSVAGTHGAGYHNRFSRHGLPSQLAHDSNADPEARRSGSSADAYDAAIGSQSRTSYEKRSSSPRGTLSDAAIAALGAMPGASAGSLLNSNGAPLSSKNILTIALQKAQNAVQLDSANNVPEAIAAYKQAVRLLEEVMERIAPRNGKRSRPSREEERRRLRVIHDTYADRIRLLSMIYSPEPDSIDRHEETSDTSFSGNAQPHASKGDWLDRMRGDNQEDPLVATPKVNGNALDADMQYSPREDSRSFLSITPVRTAFGGSSKQVLSQASAQQQEQNQHPWPRSPPMPSAPLSPLSTSLDTSPRRRVKEHVRPGSRGSRNSRASISLSIADEQEVQDYRIPPPAIEEELSRISVEVAAAAEAAKGSDTDHDHDQSKETARDSQTLPPREARGVEALIQQHQHGRSDSDSSYQSTTTGSRLKPSSLPHRGFGLEDEVRTPVTPYFDATGETRPPDESAADQQARQQKLSMTGSTKARVEALEKAAEKPAERPAKMGLAQRARALSFKGQLLRSKASMPSLSDRKKDDAGNGAATPKAQVNRPGTAESPSTEATPMHRNGSGSDHPTPWDEETSSSLTVRPGSNRPRASTSSVLVSATTSAGTISQRRKGGAHTPVAEGSPRGLSDELEELSLAEERSDERSSGRFASLAMSSRQRSTSQPGSARRPTIPAAFVTANACTPGGTLPASLSGQLSPSGESVPPPVPDLARTLSALEAKRGVDARSAATDGAGAEGGAAAPFADVSMTTSSLAMPLPTPFLKGDPEEEQAFEGGKTTFLITDIFPSGLPSLAAGAPSYASATISTCPQANVPLPLAPHSLLKPFYLASRLQRSITAGANVTPSLYLSPNIWRQAGVKLLSVETKIRSMETLISSLESVEKGGEALLMPLGSGAGMETSNASRFVRLLEEFEAVMTEVQASLVKKLPFIEAYSANGNGGGGGVADGGAFGEKGGANGSSSGSIGKVKGSGFGFGSRFTRGLDRMTGGGMGMGTAKALDSTSIATYVDTLSRLFNRLSFLSNHLTWVLVSQGTIAPPFSSSSMSNNAMAQNGAPMSSPTGIGTAQTNKNAYSALPPQIRTTIQTKLKRSSEFVGKVVLVFVLQDVGLLLERATKRGSGMFVD